VTSALLAALGSPYTGLILVTAIWGGLHPLGKIVMREATPVQFILARIVFGCLLLGLLLAVQGKAGQVSHELHTRPALIALLGAVSFFGSSGLAMIALSMLPASVSSLLSNTSPLFIAVGAIVVSRGRVNRRTIAGIVLGFVGLGLVVFGEDPAGFGHLALSPLGIALSLTGSVLWAVYIVIGRKALAAGNPIAVVVGSGLFGGAPWLIVALVTGDLMRFTQLSLATLALLVALGVIGTGVTYGIWTATLPKLNASSVAVFQYAIPFWAVVLSVTLLGEPLTIPLVLGGIGIVAGIAITQRSSK
jgi:drug/metabolite transporter (DMT)-like permease